MVFDAFNLRTDGYGSDEGGSSGAVALSNAQVLARAKLCVFKDLDQGMEGPCAFHRGKGASRDRRRTVARGDMLVRDAYPDCARARGEVRWPRPREPRRTR